MKNKARKKICFFSGDITRSGGTERVATLLANHLAQNPDFQVLCLSLVEQNEQPFFDLSDQIPHFTLDSRKTWISPGPAYLPLVPRLRRFLKEQEIDILIDIDTILDLLSIPATTSLRTKLIAWDHFNYYYAWPSRLYRGLRKLSARFTVRHADYLVLLTEEDKKIYCTKLGRKRNITAIPNPVIPPCAASFSSASRENIIVTVGRLTYIKGTDYLLKLIPSILKKHPDWKWCLLGDGEDLPQLEAMQKKYHLENQLILTGNVSNVSDYLFCASMLVMTSRSEGLPMVLLEAAACGLPCISFDIPTGPKEIIEDGKTGFLIPPFETDQMAEKMELLMQDASLRRTFSQNTEQVCRKFDSDSIFQKWEHLLNSL